MSVDQHPLPQEAWLTREWELLEKGHTQVPNPASASAGGGLVTEEEEHSLCHQRRRWISVGI